MASDKKRMGRPLKFESVELLQNAIDAYFRQCDPHMEEVSEWVEARNTDGSLRKDEYGMNYLIEVTHKIKTEQIPYTISGLALALDTSRETLLDYEENPKFSDTVKRAKERCQTYAERALFTTTPTGAIFNLKNNYGWQDQTQLEHSGRIDRNVSEAELDAVLSRRQSDTQAS